jgi:hypothetical protein
LCGTDHHHHQKNKNKTKQKARGPRSDLTTWHPCLHFSNSTLIFPGEIHLPTCSMWFWWGWPLPIWGKAPYPGLAYKSDSQNLGPKWILGPELRWEFKDYTLFSHRNGEWYGGFKICSQTHVPPFRMWSPLYTVMHTECVRLPKLGHKRYSGIQHHTPLPSLRGLSMTEDTIWGQQVLGKGPLAMSVSHLGIRSASPMRHWAIKPR